jgi:hypothetical protein
MPFNKSFKQDQSLNPQSGVIDMSETNGAFSVPSGTTAQRPANPVNGTLRYNTTIPQLEIYIKGLWNALP